MAWIILVVAGMLEVGWAVGLKYTEGFTRLWPSIANVSAMGVSVAFYAVWTGIGTIGTVIVGIVFF